jgi:hypothetical protein
MVKITQMNRSDYYTLSDIQKTFKVTRKQLDAILTHNQIKPSRIVQITTTYTVHAHYYHRHEIDQLNLEKRSPA